MYSSEKEALVRAAVKKEYCKGAKPSSCKISKKNVRKINFFF